MRRARIADMRIVLGVEAGRELVKLIESARRRVVAVTPFVSEVGLELLCRASSRGARVVLVTTPETAHSLRARAVECGIELLAIEGLHAKVYSVDGRVLTGSLNLTSGGLRSNIEILIDFGDSEEGRELEKAVEKLIELYAHRLSE